MLLIADSGSTKADWILINPDSAGDKVISEFRTAGLSPVYLSEKTILEILSSEMKLKDIVSSVNELKFFGTGCGNEEGKNRMTDILTKFFPSANVFVENDLMAAALATCGNEKGIVSILGTGSNCCYFDGIKIHVKNFGLGYILGDEAGGDYFGKNFLRAYLYDQLPQHLYESFYSEYHLTREAVIEAVYRKPNANLFFSSFMPFFNSRKKDAWIKDFLERGIEDFFQSNVLSFPEAKTAGLHFVGSVAAELEDIIREKGRAKNLSIGKIIKQPKEGLIEYYVR